MPPGERKDNLAMLRRPAAALLVGALALMVTGEAYAGPVEPIASVAVQEVAPVPTTITTAPATYLTAPESTVPRWPESDFSWVPTTLKIVRPFSVVLGVLSALGAVLDFRTSSNRQRRRKP